MWTKSASVNSANLVNMPISATIITTDRDIDAVPLRYVACHTQGHHTTRGLIQHTRFPISHCNYTVFEI